MSTQVNWDAVLGAVGQALGSGVKGFTRGSALSLYNSLAQKEGVTPEFLNKIKNYPYGKEWLTQYLRSSPVDDSHGYRKEILELSERIPYFASLGTPEGKLIAESLSEKIKRLQEEEKIYREDLAGYNKEKVSPYKETAQNANKLLELYDLLKENNRERKEEGISNWVSDIWRRAHLYKNELLAMNDLERIIGAKAFAALNFKEKAGTNVSQREFETIMRKFVSPTNTFKYNLRVLHEPLLTSMVHAAFTRAHETLNPSQFKDLYDYKKALGRKGFELLKKERRFLDIAREAQRLGSDVVNLISHEMLVPLELIEHQPPLGEKSEVSSGSNLSSSRGDVSDEEVSEDSFAKGALPPQTPSFDETPPTEENSFDTSPPPRNPSYTLGDFAQELQSLPQEDINALAKGRITPTLAQNISADAINIAKSMVMAKFGAAWDFVVKNIILPLSKKIVGPMAIENRELLDLPVDEVVKMLSTPEFKKGVDRGENFVKDFFTVDGATNKIKDKLNIPREAGTKGGDVLSNAAFMGTLGAGALGKGALKTGEKFLEGVGKWAGKSLAQGALTQGLQDLGTNPLVADLVALGTPALGSKLTQIPKAVKESLKDYSREELKNKWFRGAPRHRRALAQDVVDQAEVLLSPVSKELETEAALLENPALLERKQNRLYKEASEALPSKVNKEGVINSLDKRIQALEGKTPASLRSKEDQVLLDELIKIRDEIAAEGEVTGQQIENFRQDAKLSKEYDPRLPKHEQSYKTTRGQALEEVADDILGNESPEYGKLQKEANAFYKKTSAEMKIKNFLDKIKEAVTPAQLMKGIKMLEIRDLLRALKQELSPEAYQNLWDVVNQIEELVNKYRIVQGRMYGNQRYLGGANTAIVALPRWIKKWFMTTNYKTLMSGRYGRNWKEFLSGVENNSPRQIEKALLDMKHIDKTLTQESSQIEKLSKVFLNHKNKKASQEEWERFKKTAQRELKDMEKKYPYESDGKEMIREMLRETEKYMTSKRDARRR